MCKNLIRMILFCGLVGVAHCGLAASSAESVQVLMPYVLVGRVVDYDNCAYDASSGITLYVRKADGTVLVKSPVFTPGGISAWNFRLDVPMASKAVDGHATKGEQLTLTAVFPDGMVYSGLLTAGESTVGSAGSYRVLRLMLAADSNGNGVSDYYEEVYDCDMRIIGIQGDFDPQADYDHDGVSNFDEYLAGTDPFDANDYFRVKQASGSESDGNYIKVTFETNPGRSYAVHETSDLTGKSGWSRGTFRETPDGAELERISNPSQTWKANTVYLLKQGDTRFYRIELEQ